MRSLPQQQRSTIWSLHLYLRFRVILLIGSWIPVPVLQGLISEVAWVHGHQLDNLIGAHRFRAEPTSSSLEDVRNIVSSAVLTYRYAGKDQTLQKYAGKHWNTALIRRKSIRMIRKYAGKIYAGKYPNRKKYAGIPSIPAYNTPEKDTMGGDPPKSSYILENLVTIL